MGRVVGKIRQELCKIVIEILSNIMGCCGIGGHFGDTVFRLQML